jgi:hypothetical protein
MFSEFISAIEDLAFPIHSSRVSDIVRRRGCIEHDFAKGLERRAIMGTQEKVVETGVKVRSSADAEKNGEGMASKIRTKLRNLLNIIIYFTHFGFRFSKKEAMPSCPSSLTLKLAIIRAVNSLTSSRLI